MSILCCDECSRYVDTDYDVEGFLVIDGKDVFLCAWCREELPEAVLEAEDNQPTPASRR